MTLVAYNQVSTGLQQVFHKVVFHVFRILAGQQGLENIVANHQHATIVVPTT
jgi:hypothetical protein